VFVVDIKKSSFPDLLRMVRVRQLLFERNWLLHLPYRHCMVSPETF